MLSGQVILVTGAAGGIGSEVAKAYADQGAIVVLLDKHIKQLETLYDTILAAGDPKPAIYPLDMKGATASDYQALADNIIAELGKLNGVVHCAASLGQLAPVVHQCPQQWAETLQINLTAPYLLTRACLPLLQQQSHSFIIFSTDANQSKAYWGAYGVSKAGIEALCEQLAMELSAEDRVKVYCIDPGKVQTPLHSRAYPALDPSQIPLPITVIPAYLVLTSLSHSHLHGNCVTALSIS